MAAKGAGGSQDTFRYPKPEALLQIQKDRPTVIEASAGTGKTYTIEHLILELLLTTDAEIENILVVTFTEKATAELVSRVRKKIRELIELTADKNNGRPDEACWLVDDEARRRLRKALSGFERASISTIHSFCNSVLTEYSFLNRRLFEQSPVEEQRVFSQIFKEVLRAELSQQKEYQPYLTAWLESDKSVDALEELLFKSHKASSPLVPAFEPKRIESALALLAETSFHEEDIKAALKENGVHGNVANAVVKRLPKLYETKEAHQASGLPRALALLNEVEFDFIQERVPEALPTEGHLARFQATVEVLKATSVPFESAIVQVFLPPVRKRLVTFKRQKGLYDFDDMINVVAESLDGPRGDELIHTLRSRYHYALIDEFQDTDSMQWRIFSKIFFESEGKNPLFVIGDPKQAIYAFRGADVHVYLRARKTVREANGQVSPLTQCFRSTPKLIEAYNWILKQDDISSFFTGNIQYDHPVEAGKPDLHLKEKDGSEALPVVLFQFEWPAGKVLLTEAKKALRARIAREIDRLVNAKPLLFGEDGKEKPISPKEIFVLTRSTRDGYEIGAALRELGVPFVYYKQEGLFQTQEAEYVRALLAAIEDPGDPSKRFHAWITPFFGLRLADLLECRDIPADHPLMSRLLDWKTLIEGKEYEAAFTRILEDSGILRRELFLKDNERALTNYNHIFETLLEELSRSRCTLSELIRTLDSFIEGRGLPVGENLDYQRLESDREAVHIMTMHMAKGLEAGVVFIYGGFANKPGGNKIHTFYENGERAAFVGSLKKAPPEIKSLVEREEEEEDQRLLYVAMTRAKARLYLPYFPEKTYIDSKGKEKTTEILRPHSCCWPLNNRLRGLLESQSDPNRLLQIEKVSCRPQLEELKKDEVIDLSDWRPAPGLILPESNDKDFQRIEQNHAGFVITSYSRMKSLRGGYHAPIDTGADVTNEPEDIQITETSRDHLPAGRAAGIFLHEVLENIDFETLKEKPDLKTWAANQDVQNLFRKLLRRHAFADRYLSHSQKLIYTSLTTPIHLKPNGSISGLHQVAQDLREVEFIYPYPEKGSPSLSTPSPLWGEGRGEGSSVEKAPYIIKRGYVKGFVDFVFEHQGLTYFADWKSDSLPTWDEKALNDHVQHNYELQAQLYALALVKMLGIHTEEIYKERFGGLLYVFLRGMKADSNGFYYERPSWDQILDWEKALIGKSRL